MFSLFLYAYTVRCFTRFSSFLFELREPKNAYFVTPAELLFVASRNYSPTLFCSQKRFLNNLTLWSPLVSIQCKALKARLLRTVFLRMRRQSQNASYRNCVLLQGKF